MNKTQANKLEHGVYRVHWKGNDLGKASTSVCAIGSKYDGRRWICCSNWTSPTNRGTDSFVDEIWDDVLKVELITIK